LTTLVADETIFVMISFSLNVVVFQMLTIKHWIFQYWF